MEVVKSVKCLRRVLLLLKTSRKINTLKSIAKFSFDDFVRTELIETPERKMTFRSGQYMVLQLNFAETSCTYYDYLKTSKQNQMEDNGTTIIFVKQPYITTTSSSSFTKNDGLIHTTLESTIPREITLLL